MGFFDGFKSKKKEEREHKENELVENGFKEYEDFYEEKIGKEVEKKIYKDVKHSEDEYKVEYRIEARRDRLTIRDRIECMLIIKCEELGIDTVEYLFSKDTIYVSTEEIIKELEKILSKTDKEIEERVIEVVAGILAKRSDKEKIEDLMKAINYKKGVVFIKK